MIEDLALFWESWDAGGGELLVDRPLEIRGRLAADFYRDLYLVNWCPHCLTAISDDEVEHREFSGRLWNIQYPLADGSAHRTVATTRP